MSRYLFEISWEVCNKVGGIHTVITTKAPYAVGEFGDHYFLLGPMLDQNTDFAETDDPFWAPIREALGQKGIRCRLGRWQIDGRPNVILVDFRDRYDVNKLLFNYWQQFGVDSYSGRWDYIEPVIFSTACGEVIETLGHALLKEGDWAVAHFHEWMCGGGLLHVKKNVPEVGTVFTTHATVLGRSMASSKKNIYTEGSRLNVSEDAKSYGVTAKHSMEATCARETDIFTTVSQFTAEEAAVILDRRPDLVVFNGFNAKALPSFDDQREAAAKRRPALGRILSRILQHELPAAARFWVTSGRYEFPNKGYDVFLQSLAELEKRILADPSIPPVVALFLIATGNTGLNEDVLKRVRGEEVPAGRPVGISTHRLWDEGNDPIIQNCLRLNLRNSTQNKVFVVFAPSYLDGQDGLFGMTYYDLLSASDLGVFPSFYEPWGYTPLESVAMGVPTVTTDLAGFGRWAMGRSIDALRGVSIIRRIGREETAVVKDLAEVLGSFASMDDLVLDKLRREARKVAELADWSDFFTGYVSAYEEAASKAIQRFNSMDTSSFSDGLFIGFKGIEGPGPHYRSFTVVTTLPKKIEGLRDIAYNLLWTWHPEAEELFAEIDPAAWEEHHHNPVRLLSSVPHDVLEAKSNDKAYLKKYERVMGEFKSYMDKSSCSFQDCEALTGRTPIAYFSMEFCLHECLPIYSGGLGVLAGDHLKAASDVNLPLVGVGLFYRQGYFKQTIDPDGRQIDDYPFLDFSQLPIKTLLDRNDEEMRVKVDIGGRTIHARVWQVRVGRVKLYLLDTDVDENGLRDRQITWRLYSGDRRIRMEQEILLGFGGVKLLEDELGLRPAVYHLNEGHSAFLLLDRVRRLVNSGLSFQEAREAVRSSSVFTTHTPVPAGNEAFEIDIMENYFSDLARVLGISWNQFIEIGREKPGDEVQPFSMTVLALKLTSRANAVSKLHGQVCREMWHNVWKEVPVEEVPITSITNGIHLTSWLGRNMRRLLGQYLDIRWDENHDDPDAWLRVSDIPDEMLWDQHLAQKRRLFDFLKKKIFDDYVRRGEDPKFIRDTLATLDPAALTFGFARRFASYKRAFLLFRKKETMARIVNDPKRPVQFLFAGKAHPADGLGKDLIRKVVELSREEEFRGRVIFLENYDMALARLLTQGVDVWLNTPVRPYEASGTSGMKVVPNGVLNCSVLDGWWDEAYAPGRGWAVAGGGLYTNRDHQDEMDAGTLIDLIEREIVPRFYGVNDQGVPEEWVAMMKEALKTVAPQFTTLRMVKEYHRDMYFPTAERRKGLEDDNFAGIRELAAWKRKINARFSTVQVEKVSIRGLKGDILSSETPLDVELCVNPGKLMERELRAELVIGHRNADGFAGQPKVVPFDTAEREPDTGRLCFRLSHQVAQSGSYGYAVRVVPVHPLLATTQETGLVLWG